MAKNGYLQKQRDMQQGFLDVGEQLGMQKMWDFIQIALRDPDVMGKDTFGKKRLMKLFQKMTALADEYSVAFADDKEADYYQKKLDDSISGIWGDDFQTFFERYPYVKQYGYQKSRKGWK